MFEETEVADIPIIDKPLMKEPDCKGPYGHPCFTYDNAEIDLPIGKILDGKERYARWLKHVPDEGIVNWAKKNPFKSFYIRKGEGPMIKVR